MTTITEYLIGFIVLLGWYLYVTTVLPKLRSRRKLFLRDWGFSPFQPMKNLFEYKAICERENESLIWFKIQIFLIVTFFLVAFIVILSWSYR